MPATPFVKPQYGSRCFADLPQTILHLLTGAGNCPLATDAFGGLPRQYNTVIFFFVDGFGWRFFEQYADRYPFLRQIVRHGAASKLTSQFPSTTAAHTATIHSGLPVNQSGIFEWQYYDPAVDNLLSPLLFSFAGTKVRDTLKPTGLDPKSIYPTHTIYEDLKKAGVDSFVFQYQEYAHSTYSDILCDGAAINSFKTLPEMLVNLRHSLTRNSGPAYYFCYFADIDSMGHKYGPSSPQFEAEVHLFFTAMDQVFTQKLNGGIKNTLLMMTADHGQMEVDPATTVFLNQNPQTAGVTRFLKTNRQGETLGPGGSARDMFLYIKDEALDEAHQFLAARLEQVAAVRKTADLIEEGYFGPLPPSTAFTSRMSNLVILPYARQSVWWYEKGRYEMNFYGHHGGLSPQEMEIPLLLYAW